MVVLPDITLLQGSFFGICVKDRIEVKLDFAHYDSGESLKYSEKCFRLKIPRKKDSKECSRKFWGMFEKIPGNVQKIPRRVRGDSMECPKRFLGTFKKISRNFKKDSGKFSERIRGMIRKIPENVTKDFEECSRGFRGSNMDLFC